MAPQGPVLGSQLCDYCHQNTKFAGHSYCTKTCAAQAATLCDHCHKKPKSPGFEYCGKYCAAQANPGGKNQARVPAGAGAAQPIPNGTVKNNNPTQQRQQQQQPTAQAPTVQIDPVQLAKLIVPYIPQVAQAFLANGNAAGASSNTAAGPTPQVMPSRHTSSGNNPFLGGVPATQQNMDNSGINQQAADDLRCLIPGCGKPVHFDAKGVKTSDYCSLRHREEAVTSGLRSPCILCLAYPQRDKDYFCSRACREESMDKFLHYDYCDEETLVSGDEETT